MNYLHGFHAGNFADVIKHAVLARILVHLLDKEKPFRVIDTHAGQGSYDLGAQEARRTGEWRHGIGRLLGEDDGGPEQPLDPELGGFLAPYLGAVSAWRAEHGRRAYPGSPAIIRHFLRRDDRLIAVEAQEQGFRRLARLFPPGSRAKALDLDGYVAWSAFIPPKERRGLVLVDPPYEAPDEFERIAATLEIAARKWPTGITLIWHPLKDRALARRFIERLAQLGLPELWRVELYIGTDADDEAGLGACGLIVVNPPWTLPGELSAALPKLAARLARGPNPSGSCERIKPAGRA